MGSRSRTVWAVIAALALVAGTVTGCGALGGQSASEESRSDGVSVAPMPPVEQDGAYDTGVTAESAPSPGGDVKAGTTEPMIIRSKTLRLEVESTTDAVADIRILTREASGTVTQLQIATDDEGPIYRYDESGYAVGDGAGLRGWMTVRVPASGFEAFVDKAMALGTVKYQAEDTEDVTQQYVDLSARLENLRAEEARLREFFDAAKNVEEMLAIESELSRVRGEIESMDAQVKYLERQAAMATVTIELVEPRPIVRPEGDTWGFGEAITDGFRGAANVINFGIALLIATSPLWLLAVAGFFVARAILRRHRAKTVAARPEAPAGGMEGPADGQ